MTKHEPQHPNTNFWFGFAIGSITLTGLAFLMGTKKGREKLKQLVEYADTIQDMPEELFNLIPAVKEMLKGTDSLDQKTNAPSHPDKSIPEKITQSLESVIEKVKHSSEVKKEGKKYFIKNDS